MLLLMLSTASVEAYADEFVTDRSMPYQEIRTLHEQFLQSNPSKSMQVDAFRSIVKSSRYGERGLNTLFRNFEGNHTIDPTIPGVTKSVRLLSSSSISQSKGYVRELLYASQLHNDPRFTLVAMNRVIKRPWGMTDADIVFRHNGTGQFSRIEVKDVSAKSQSSNLEKYKTQIDKMSLEGRRTGQQQYWINRKEVIPEISRYANSKGVSTYGDVKTGRTNPQKTVFVEVMNDLNRDAIRLSRARSVMSGGRVAFGALMLSDSAPKFWDDLEVVAQATNPDKGDWLRIGEHASYTVGGSAMVLSGSAMLAGQYGGEVWRNRMYSVGRTGGLVSVVALSMGEGFQIARFRNGDITSQEFWTSQWVMGASIAGTYVGAKIGGAATGIATANPIGIFFGAGVGGVTGAWVGGKTAKAFSDDYYDSKFTKLNQEFAEFVYKSYRVQ